MTAPRAVSPVCAVILAAGLGRRLGGYPKAALRHPEGDTLLQRTVHALRTAGVPQVSVVLGPYQDVLSPLVQTCAAHPLPHTLPEPSLIDSQRLALTDHAARHPGADVLLLLSDLPGLTAAHFIPVLTAWRARAERGDEGIHALMPVVNGQRGHPVLLSAQAVQAIVQQPSDLGVRAWLAAHPQAVHLLTLDDGAYVGDVDTPEDMGRWGLEWGREPPQGEPHHSDASHGHGLNMGGATRVESGLLPCCSRLFEFLPCPICPPNSNACTSRPPPPRASSSTTKG